MKAKRIISLMLCMALAGGSIFSLTEKVSAASAKEDKPLVLRVCNWEEYIDEGDWDEEELIELENCEILGENHMVEDFEEWYEQTYGAAVKVEYSTFGTNEDLYNMLTLGDVYDLVCPSEYMIMKLMAEDKLVPLSEEFFDETDENNYYTNGVASYIRNIFESNEINGESWDQYAAGYMWGITGFVYNPEEVTPVEASTWQLIGNNKFEHQITIKDNIRDSYFAAVGAVKHDLLTSEEFCNDPDYVEKLKAEMNDVSPETIHAVQDYLQQSRNNLYSFETDSGKADMITGKVLANYQWSGDAVYTMDQAEEDDFYLNFAVPEESTNIYFDGWVMLKSGISEDERKQHAAEAFINFLSRPDNVVRNMYYIGYTSVISGGDDTTVFEYADWLYGADPEEEDPEDLIEYPLGYFFSDDPEDEDYIITTWTEQAERQLGAQYPSEATISRSSIMVYWNDEISASTNQMWINIRCYNIKDIPTWIWAASVIILIGLIYLYIVNRKRAVKK